MVIALSACGRLRVISATATVGEVLQRARAPRSPRRRGGGPKSSASQRSVPVADAHRVLSRVATRHVSSSASQRSALRLGAKQYSPPRVTTNGGRSCSRRRIGRCGIVKRARLVVRSDEGVVLERGADEDAVVEPLGLDELELALEVRAGEDEDDPAVDAVVLEHAVGQHRPVARAAPDHPVQAHVDAALVVQRVARVRPAGVGTDRALEPARIVAEEEVVVALRIAPQLRVVARRATSASGAPLCQRPTIFAPSSASSSRLGGPLAQVAAGRPPPSCAACGTRRRCRCDPARPGSASVAARRSRRGSRG